MGVINYKEAANSSFQNVAAGVSSGLGSALGGLINKVFNPAAYKAAMREHLTGAEREQNAFNAQQAALQRQWNEKIMDREVELENTSYQRQVADMQAAGVNPALMYGGAGASGAGTPSAGSGAAASAAGASPADLQALVQMQMAGAQIGLIRAQTEKTKAETGETQERTRGFAIDNLYKPEYWQNFLSIQNAEKSKIEADTKLAIQKLHTEEFETALKQMQVDIAEVDLSIKTYECLMAKMDADSHQKLIDLSIRAAELANDKASAEIDEINAQIGLIYQQTATEAAKAGMFSAEEQKTLEELGIIKDTHESTVATAKANAHSAEVASKWATANQWISAGAKVAGAIASGIGAAGVAKTAFNLFGKAASRIGYK